MPVEIRELVVKATVNPAPTVQQLEERIAQLEKFIQVLGDRITVQSGGSSVSVSTMGVVIAARDVTINASGKVVVKASGDVEIKGARIRQN
jgi:hypothetical protein